MERAAKAKEILEITQYPRVRARPMRIYLTSAARIFRRAPARSRALHLTQSAESVRASPFPRFPVEGKHYYSWSRAVLQRTNSAGMSCCVSAVATDDGHVRRIIRCGNKKSGAAERPRDARAPRKGIDGAGESNYLLSRDRSTTWFYTWFYTWFSRPRFNPSMYSRARGHKTATHAQAA